MSRGHLERGKRSWQRPKWPQAPEVTTNGTATLLKQKPRDCQLPTAVEGLIPCCQVSRASGPRDGGVSNQLKLKRTKCVLELSMMMAFRIPFMLGKCSRDLSSPGFLQNPCTTWTGWWELWWQVNESRGSLYCSIDVKNHVDKPIRPTAIQY